MDSNVFQHQLQTTGSFFLRPVRILRSYQADFLRPDLIAGLTIAVILIPQSMAYALIAELPPQLGLYTAIIGSIVGSLWGSSDQLQTGPRRPHDDVSGLHENGISIGFTAWQLAAKPRQ